VALFFIKKNFKKTHVALPRGDFVIVSCRGVHLGGNPGKKNLQGRISTKIFSGDKPECAYFVGGKHLFTLFFIGLKT
jgi:hypothetical protein